MDDLVKRLRAPAYWMSGSSEGHEGENDAPREAASRIEAQAEEIERLKVSMATFDQISEANVRLNAKFEDALADIERLREALTIISGGYYDTAASMVLSGNWQQFVTAMQATARAALEGKDAN